MNNSINKPNNVDKVQELARILDATITEINPAGLATGENGMAVIRFLSSTPNFENFVGPEFAQHVKSEITKSENKANVREYVKKVYMYPKYSYDPWIPLEVEQTILCGIHEELSKLEFEFKMSEGKVYLVLANNGGNISEFIHNCVKNLLPYDIIPNTEASHVTVVNSNIVYNCGVDKVSHFMEKHCGVFSLQFGNIKSTTSNDWPVFSECYVIEVKSDVIARFVNEFNGEFGTSIKPSPHITFGIRPRTLLKKN